MGSLAPGQPAFRTPQQDHRLTPSAIPQEVGAGFFRCLWVLKMHLMDVTVTHSKDAVVHAFNDVLKNRTFQAAAALSYYSILSIFPALILLSAVMAYIPVPDFFADALAAMARVVPPGTMPMVYSILIGALGPNLHAWLSFGTVGTLWVVSSAFDEMIDALDIAYDVTVHRPMWKARFLAVGLAFSVGLVLMGAVATMVVGPKAGAWLANRMSLSAEFSPALARYPLDPRRWFRRIRGADDLLPCSQRKTTVPIHAARRRPLCRLLAGALRLTRRLLSLLRELQPALRNFGWRDGADDLALLGIFYFSGWR